MFNLIVQESRLLDISRKNLLLMVPLDFFISLSHPKLTLKSTQQSLHQPHVKSGETLNRLFSFTGKNLEIDLLSNLWPSFSI